MFSVLEDIVSAESVCSSVSSGGATTHGSSILVIDCRCSRFEGISTISSALY
jgi:hypothetical protein